MNAPDQIKPKGSARRAAYAPMVRTHLPGCEGEELGLRCGMLLMRDYATARLKWCCEEPGVVLEHIERLATRYAYASLPIKTLEQLHFQMTRLGAAASGLMALFPAPEGKDARG